MKNCSKLSLLGSLLVLTTSFACADSVSLGSFATGTTAASLGFNASQTAMNLAGFTPFATPPIVGSTPTLLSGTASTFALAPTTVWSTALGNSTWVGNAATAGPAGGINPAWGYYQYTTSFTAVGGTGYTALMSLMADDTAEVLLNGVVLVPFGSIGSDGHCASSGISCLGGNLISLTGLTLLSGTDGNMFTFVVEQAGTLSSLDPSGVDFTATVASSIAPEPSSLILLGTGLLGAAGLLLRKRKIV